MLDVTSREKGHNGGQTKPTTILGVEQELVAAKEKLREIGLFLAAEVINAYIEKVARFHDAARDNLTIASVHDNFITLVTAPEIFMDKMPRPHEEMNLSALLG